MADTPSNADEASSSGRTENPKPTVVLVIGVIWLQHTECTGTLTLAPDLSAIPAGMAGSGKTTLLQRLNSHLHTTNTPGYIINLDPAVTQVPYGANIDIRDTVRNDRIVCTTANL